MFHALFRIGKEEGIRALYSGYGTDFISHLFLWVVSLYPKSSPLSPPCLRKCNYWVWLFLKGFLLHCWDKPPTAQSRSEPTIPWRGCLSAAQKVSAVIALSSGVILCFQEVIQLVLGDVVFKPDLFVLKAANQWKGFKSSRVKQKALICWPLLCFYTFWPDEEHVNTLNRCMFVLDFYRL